MFPEGSPTAEIDLKESLTSSSIPSLTTTLMKTPQPAPTMALNTILETPFPVATARQPLRFGRAKFLDQGGFSFQPPIGFEDAYLPGQATLKSPDGATIISMIGAPFASEGEVENILLSFLEMLSTSGTFQAFESATPYPYSVDGSPGLAADVTGEMGGTPFHGRVVIVIPTEEQLFYALAFSASGPSGDSWEPSGRQAFEAIINSIDFYKPVIEEE